MPLSVHSVDNDGFGAAVGNPRTDFVDQTERALELSFVGRVVVLLNAPAWLVRDLATESPHQDLPLRRGAGF